VRERAERAVACGAVASDERIVRGQCARPLQPLQREGLVQHPPAVSAMVQTDAEAGSEVVMES
jgi:hypothetical protein